MDATTDANDLSYDNNNSDNNIDDDKSEEPDSKDSQWGSPPNGEPEDTTAVAKDPSSDNNDNPEEHDSADNDDEATRIVVSRDTPTHTTEDDTDGKDPSSNDSSSNNTKTTDITTDTTVDIARVAGYSDSALQNGATLTRHDSNHNRTKATTKPHHRTRTRKERLFKKVPPAFMVHPSQPFGSAKLLLKRSTRPLVGTNFSQWWKLQPDNWNLRQLCGTKCHQANKYQLDIKEHFEYTLDRLSRFHTILFQEQLQDSVTVLSRRLNWTQWNLTHVQELVDETNRQKLAQRAKITRAPTAKEKERRKMLLAKKQKRMAEKKQPGPEQLVDWDPSMSALDDALYEIAQHWEEDKRQSRTLVHAVEGWKELLTSTTRQALEHYFDDDNPQRHACSNECCAPLCSAW